MTRYRDVWEMDFRLLVIEFKRLTIIESKGEIDESVSYQASDLEQQIMHRLTEHYWVFETLTKTWEAK